jgi:hypothetical protein
MASQREPISKQLRFEVFLRDSFTCQYCGRSAPDVVLHVEHKHPVSRGGKNDIGNLVTACSACNLGKGARVLRRPAESTLCSQVSETEISDELDLTALDLVPLRAVPAAETQEQGIKRVNAHRRACARQQQQTLAALYEADRRAFHYEEFGQAARFEDAILQVFDLYAEDPRDEYDQEDYERCQ